MTDSAAARAALDVLQQALTAHLQAVEARTGEHDLDVQQAYAALRDAASAYDLALFEQHDEVTPFDLPAATGDEDDDIDEDPDRLSLLGRWDFTLADRKRLLAAAAKVAEGVDSPAFGLTVLAAVHGAPALSDPKNAAALGLVPHGGTTWVVGSDAEDDEDDEEWMEDPFTAEPGDVLCRYDQPVED